MKRQRLVDAIVAGLKATNAPRYDALDRSIHSMMQRVKAEIAREKSPKARQALQKALHYLGEAETWFGIAADEMLAYRGRG